MKLYKDGRCMQFVDKEQLQDCLDAGWSRTDKVAEEAKALAEKEAAEEAELLAQIEAEEAEAEEVEEADKEDSAPPKKTVKIKTSKKSK
jgi:predicted  nucleic acid-binding Zn-ribbon protein